MYPGFLTPIQALTLLHKDRRIETLSRVKIRASRVGNRLEEMHGRSLGLDLLSWGGAAALARPVGDSAS
jgi:hypothetical protein